MNRYGFYLDTSACTGCKACQIACKDKNKLPVGMLWRKVVEVEGGEWLQNGPAWTNSVFTYFVSTACNHCDRPICVGICPTGAMHQREDGIVLLDPDRCMGCRYCEMACPYHAPQFDLVERVMTKCNFCVDLVDVGQSPACVAACQMRALHFGDLEELRGKFGEASAVYPLPAPELTEPALVLTLHPESIRKTGACPRIGNWEEIE
jgi:anaerobic dimethyl sulfoxide reductase subunit B (iron-sulfur subunit)